MSRGLKGCGPAQGQPPRGAGLWEARPGQAPAVDHLTTSPPRLPPVSPLPRAAK